MRPERLPPDDPKEWLNRARSSLAQARGGIDLPGVYPEDLCFQAQQAAEKAIKGVLIRLRVRFPYVHDLGKFLNLVDEAGQPVPGGVMRAGDLTEYAIETRYPGMTEPVTPQEYEDAVAIAETVVRWAESVILRGT
ncbi:MAG: HEPN domain-containing protein [Chloroflexi bacterium]|nr:HEPN domain-containing protein [Chloroflexota bacterium]